MADTRAAAWTSICAPRAMPSRYRPLDLAYRIIQEALTNCRKHAGGASTAIVIRYDRDWVDLQIENDTSGASVSPDDGGHGLIGMRERFHLYGGSLEVGPRADGGFVVRARLPRAASQSALVRRA